ncbi:MAG: YCF48-related protein, partial [Ignavibacteriaceae bacterium]
GDRAMRYIRIYLLLIIIITSFPKATFSQWELRYPKIPTTGISDMVFLNPQTGFAVNSSGNILRTTDGGAFWIIAQHYQREYISEIKFVNQSHGFAISPHGYIGDQKDFIYTTDGGDNWSATFLGTSDAMTFLPLSASAILKSNESGTISLLDNFWGQWSERYIIPYYSGGGLPSPYGDIKEFEKLPSERILALGSSWNAFQNYVITDSAAFILFSDDSGLSWDTLWCDLPKILTTFSFYDNYTGWIGGKENEIYKTTDGGLSWSLSYSEPNPDPEKGISKIIAVDVQTVYAVSTKGEFISSADGGNTWNVYSIIPSTNYELDFNLCFINAQKGFVFGPDLWVTTDGGNTWDKVDDSIKPTFFRIQFLSTELGFGIGGDNYYGGESFYRTADGGYNWENIYNQNTGGSYNGFFMQDSLRGWLTNHNALFKTTDGGFRWTEVYVDTLLDFMRSVEFFDDSLGILFEVRERFNDFCLNYVTTDGGNSWQKYQVGNLPYMSSFTKIKRTDPSHIWFANQQGLWLSGDTAKTWDLISSQISVIGGGFDFIDSLNGWAAHLDGTQDKVKFTTDGGQTWSTLTKPYMNQTTDLIIDGRDYFGRINVTVAGLYGSIFGFEEGWSHAYIQNSYTNNWLYSIAAIRQGNTVHKWISGMGGIILYRNDYITGIEDEYDFTVKEFSLYQNYPNPFNPSTKISWQSPVGSWQTLKVFDVLGREVATLVDEYRDASYNEVEFNSAGMASGVYYYQLKAGSYVETKKMVVIK